MGISRRQKVEEPVTKHSDIHCTVTYISTLPPEVVWIRMAPQAQMSERLVIREWHYLGGILE